jgi:cell division protein FtsL
MKKHFILLCFLAIAVSVSAQKHKNNQLTKQQKDSIEEAKYYEEWMRVADSNHVNLENEVQKIYLQEKEQRKIFVDEIQDVVVLTISNFLKIRKIPIGECITKIKSPYPTVTDSVQVPVELMYAAYAREQMIEIQKLLTAYMEKYPSSKKTVEKKVAAGMTESYTMTIFPRYDSSNIRKVITVCREVTEYTENQMINLCSKGYFSKTEEQEVALFVDEKAKELASLLGYSINIKE